MGWKERNKDERCFKVDPYGAILAFWSILELKLEGKYKIGRAGGGYTFLKYWHTSDVLSKRQMGEKKEIKMKSVQS